MKHALAKGLTSQNVREIYDAARSKAFKHWIDEKGTEDNPGVWCRKPSKLSYEEAFDLIRKNKPHWVVSFRNDSYFGPDNVDYWEFGGCNLASNNYGEVFIWILVSVEDAETIFKDFGLSVESY